MGNAMGLSRGAVVFALGVFLHESLGPAPDTQPPPDVVGLCGLETS